MEEENTNPQKQPTFEEQVKAKKELYELISNGIKDIIIVIADAIKFFVTKKYSHDFTGLIIFSSIVVSILVTICILACNNRISEPTIGAILGSLIGYALGRFSNSSNGKSEK